MGSTDGRVEVQGPPRTSPASSPGGRPGQALTELALLLPLLALLFVGVLDLGRAYHTQVAAANAARVGLLYAQQVASPRLLDCLPGTTCRFLTVADVISTTQQEAQGGIDAAQMRVGVCLQHVSACPITDTTIAVASTEAITVSVTVPFTAITPFVHLRTISGSVSGQTFPFEPVAPAALATLVTMTPSATATATPLNTATATATTTPPPTSTATPATTSPTLPPGSATATATAPGAVTATATTTPPSTATAGPAATPTVPAPVISMAIVSSNPLSHTVTIQWTSTQPLSQNAVWVRGSSASTFTQVTASSGTTGSLTFSSDSNQVTGARYLSPDTYDFYVQSTTSGGTATQPTAGASCRGNGANTCGSFTLS